MSDKEPKKVLSLGGSKPKLELKKPVASDSSAAAAGSVRQSFSHGRSKAVAVEVKRKRSDAPSAASPQIMEKRGVPQMVKGPESGTAVSASGKGRARSAILGQLTDEEKEARLRALRGAASEGGASQREYDDFFAAPSEPSAPAETDLVAEQDSSQPMTARERLRQREMEELRSIREQEKKEGEKRKQEDEQRAASLETAKGSRSRPTGDAVSTTARRGAAVGVAEESDPRRVGRGGRGRTGAGEVGDLSTAKRGAGAERRRGGKITVTQALTDDEGQGRRRSMASLRRRMERNRRQAEQQAEQVKVTRDVTIPEVITVQELANRMAERGTDVIKTLMKMGVMATITQSIDADTAELVATEMGHRVRRVAEADVETGISGESDAPESLMPRPPVVTVMGHVDHGKTSLLDAMRKTRVAAGEAGGITQHIGAYQVISPKSVRGINRITFIDTPGHAAFTEMRARGANITDIVILVVAADDGIMPQTIEAIRHAKAAGAPIIVAINKCDLPAANPSRVRQDLLQHDIQVEEMGGEVLSVEISAKTRKGLDKLEEAVLLQAEMMDLKANPDHSAEGAVVEAKLEKGRGAVATVLVKRGTLKVGDIFVAGCEWGRVRALINDSGENVASATPATPVEVLGINGTPVAGDDLTVVQSEARAREIAEFRQRRRRSVNAAANQRSSLTQMLDNIKAGAVKELAVLIKGDVHGSVEALKNSLIKLSADNTEVKVRALDAAVGAITESDVTLARASGGMIIGFNVRANPQAREMARRDGVEIRYYSVIYNAIDDVRQALTGMLSPDLREKFLGNAQILQVFNITKVGKVAGCKISEGVVKRGAKVRLLRDNVVIHEGTLKTLKRVKDEVKEVREGFECGMAFENYDNIQAGDVIECFEIEEIARQL